MENSRFYLHRDGNCVLFLYNSRLYYEAPLAVGNGRTRNVLISMDIHDRSLQYHSSSSDVIPPAVLGQMQQIATKLSLDRQALVTEDLHHRKVNFYRVNSQSIEYVIYVYDERTREVVAVYYDFYSTPLVGGKWVLETPFYFQKGILNRNKVGLVRKLYRNGRGEPYFMYNGTRMKLSDFTLLFSK